MSSISRSTILHQTELSVSLTTGGKFLAAVRRGGQHQSVGKFKTESAAWLAAQHGAKEIARMEDLGDSPPAKGIERLLNVVTSTSPVGTEIERGKQWDTLLAEFLGRSDADSIYGGDGADDTQTGSGAAILCAVPMTYLLPSGRVLVTTDGHKHGPCRSDVLRLYQTRGDWSAERAAQMGDRWDGLE